MEFPIPRILCDAPDLNYIQFLYNKFKSMSVDSFEGKSKLISKNVSKCVTKAQINLLLDNIIYSEDLVPAYAHNPTVLSDMVSEAEVYCNDLKKRQEETSFSHMNFSSDSLIGGKSISQKPTKLTSWDFSKHRDTFLRIQKKMENIKRFYPELYYRNQSIIEIFANSTTSPFMDSTILEYDDDTSDLIWI